jgi:hypothetical protein
MTIKASTFVLRYPNGTYHAIDGQFLTQTASPLSAVQFDSAESAEGEHSHNPHLHWREMTIVEIRHEAVEVETLKPLDQEAFDRQFSDEGDDAYDDDDDYEDDPDDDFLMD